MFYNILWNFWFFKISDFFLIQFLLIYLLYWILISTNIYYTVFYFFLLIIYLSIILCFFQLDLFTGFLLLVECVLIFALLLLMFFLKPTGSNSDFNFKNNYYIYSFFLVITFVMYLNTLNFNLNENKNLNWLNSIEFWDDYYEALNNTNINDFTGFLISYYNLNSWEFLFIGFIILIASMVCVNLYKKIKINKIKSIDNLIQIINFFKQSIEFIFMRQQNLNTQNSSIPSTRILKKKNKI